MSCEGWPSAVTLYARAGELELVWDALPAVLTGQRLRAACRCSGCESARRRGCPPEPDAGVRLTHIEILGSGGLQCMFSDGHERGIYPWPYLHALAYGAGTSHERIKQ